MLKYLIMALIFFSCPVFGIDETSLPLDEFFDGYRSKGDANCNFYSNATILVSFSMPDDPGGEYSRRWRISSRQGNLISERFGDESDVVSDVSVFRADAVFSVRRRPDGAWKPSDLILRADEPERQPHLGEESMSFFSYMDRPFKELARSAENGFFTKASTTAHGYKLYVKFSHSELKTNGWFEFDRSYRCMSFHTRTVSSEDPEYQYNRIIRYEYSGVDSSGADVVSRCARYVIENGVEVLDREEVCEVTPVPAEQEKFSLTYYGLSENLLKSRNVQEPWWNKIPQWSIFVVLALIFFSAAAWWRSSN